MHFHFFFFLFLIHIFNRLSLVLRSGFYMSELLHIFGQIDDRVRPLVFTVRYWANEMNITSNENRPQITNFPLTCLVLCFLQQLPQPILPTLSDLERKTRVEDIRVTGNINCTFVRDLSQFKFNTQNTASLEELLIGFFMFLVHIDFDEYGISLHIGQPIRKRNSSPLYIENPLERELNVSKIVTHQERDRIQAIAESSLAELVPSSSRSLANPWGILTFKNGALTNK